jgi:hypothetical protein
VRQICAKHGLCLVASPPDLPDLLASAGYAPIPLRYGGGTRIKVLEAMAAGLVVCATEKAVEGLSLQDGRHFPCRPRRRRSGYEDPGSRRAA